MKIRFGTIPLLITTIFIVGCTASNAEESVVIRELPIEATVGENGENIGLEKAGTESSSPSVEAKETYEEIRVEVNGNQGTITVGTTGAPFTEILTQAKIMLAKDGWDLQIKKYDDYRKLNEDVESGVLDAHLFAHGTYAEGYNDLNGTSLAVADDVVYETYGVYSKTNQDLTKQSGAKVAIPANVPEMGRALLFLQDIGWVTLKEEAGLTAIVEDIVDNPKKLQFVEYDLNSLEQMVQEADYCIMGANVAIVEGFSVEDHALQKDMEHYESVKVLTTVLVSSEENVENAKLKALVKVLDSKEMGAYVEEAYEGAYVLVH